MAITRTATPTSFSTSDAVTNWGFNHNVAAGSTLLILTVITQANISVSGTPTWNTNQDFTLIHATTSTGLSTDMRLYVYGLVNPAPGNNAIGLTVTGTVVCGFACATSYLGTISSSVADATNFVAQQVNDAAALTVAMNAGSSGTAGATALAFAGFYGGDGDPADETASSGQFTELFDNATGTSTTTDISFWVGEKINWTPAPVTVDWVSTSSDECAGVLIEILPFIGPEIASVDSDNDTVDTRTGVVISGANFGATETGSAKVEISNNATYGSGTVVEVDVTSWSGTSITVTLRRESDSAALSGLFTLPLSPAYLWVTDSAGVRNPIGFQFTLRPPGPTALANLNTSATLEVDTTYLLRMRARNTGGVGGTTFALWCSRNGGAYFKVTTTSGIAKAVAAAAYADGDDVLEVLTGSGTYITDNNAASETGTITLPAGFAAGGAINALFAVQIVGADVNDDDALLFRMGSASAADFTTYTNTAGATVNKVGGGESKSGSDTIAASISDSAVLAAGVASADTAAASISESSALATAVASADTVAMSISDSGALAAADASSDTLAVLTSEVGVLGVASSDTIAIGTTEVGASAAAMIGTDSLALGITDSGALAASVASADTVAAATSETGAAVAALTSSDTVAVATSETGSLAAPNAVDVGAARWVAAVSNAAVQKSGSDTLALTLTDSPALAATAASADTAAASLTDTGTLAAAVSRADTLAVAVSDSGAVNTAAVSSSDSLSVATSESGSLEASEQKSGSDTLAVSVSEQVAAVAALASSDAAALALVDQGALVAVLAGTDTATVAIADSPAAVAALSGTDSLTVATTETPLLVTPVASSDSLALSVTDAASLDASHSAADALGVAVTDSGLAVAAVASSDALVASTAESVTLAANSAGADTLGVAMSEVGSLEAPTTAEVGAARWLAQVTEAEVQKFSSDTIAVSTNESGALSVQVASSDAIAVALSEAGAVAAALPGIDTLALATAEVAAVPAVAVSGADSLEVAALQASLLSGQLTGSDIIAVAIDQASLVGIPVASADTVAVGLTDLAVALGIATADTLNLAVLEEPSLPSVIGNVLTLHGRVKRTATLAADLAAPVLTGRRSGTVQLSGKGMQSTPIHGNVIIRKVAGGG